VCHGRTGGHGLPIMRSFKEISGKVKVAVYLRATL
jgi:hypothetical protein